MMDQVLVNCILLAVLVDVLSFDLSILEFLFFWPVDIMFNYQRKVCQSYSQRIITFIILFYRKNEGRSVLDSLQLNFSKLHSTTSSHSPKNIFLNHPKNYFLNIFCFSEHLKYQNTFKNRRQYRKNENLLLFVELWKLWADTLFDYEIFVWKISEFEEGDAFLK